MAQHDYVIANGTGAATRADLNNGLAAIVSNNSGATEPATMYAYQWWADTTTGLLKLRNAANSAWVTVGTLASANLGLAALASPTFTGTVTAPTFTASTAVNIPLGSAGSPTLFFTGDTNTGLFSPGADAIALATAGTNRLHITSSGNVGIGTTSPNSLLTVGTLDANAVITPGGANTFISFKAMGADGGIIFGAGGVANGTPGTERARIDSSGRLLVGTSTARANFFNSTVSPLIQQEGVSGSSRFAAITYGTNAEDDPIFILGKHRGASVGGTTVVNSGDGLGKISFQGSDGTEFVEGAAIRAEVDGTPGANDMPGRLVFATSSDGSSSPTERMRISADGTVLIQKTTFGIANEGFQFRPGAGGGLTNNQNPALYLNRLGTDGTIVSIQQDSVEEGTISVSGSTVSYNGAHLSRWSQLPGNAEREEILRGTVLSNIDEMCNWGEEENEQLNRMKVSDVEGDPNVSGVFQAWDDDDDTYTDDFYCAMTGDFIIRIAEGTPVHRGQLLMSAGDGTAKPQGDGFVQDKTIAKVTSNHVTCTYDDGSYCVPCVLMAC